MTGAEEEGDRKGRRGEGHDKGRGKGGGDTPKLWQIFMEKFLN